MTEPTDGIRVGLYYAPAPDDPLARRAAVWLGRDPESNAPLPQPDLPDIAAITADARRYGFHATLKPPMRLKPGTHWDEVVAAARALAAGIPPFDLPPLAVADLHGFLAIRETTPCPALHATADLAVAELDHLRAPAPPEELARRRRHGLPPAQERMLVRWGYPHVFATWYFHMTLTRRLNPAEHAIYLPAATAFFADALAQPRRFADLCLFTERAPGTGFTIAERFPLFR